MVISGGRVHSQGPPFPVPAGVPMPYSGVDWGGLGVKDVLKIPESLRAGKYILGFRYDCEATAQVWSNCADGEFITCTTEIYLQDGCAHVGLSGKSVWRVDVPGAEDAEWRVRARGSG